MPQALIGPFQLGSSLLLVEGRGRVQQLILQDVVFHFIGLQLLGHVHLTDLRRQRGANDKLPVVNDQIESKLQKSKLSEVHPKIEGLTLRQD